MERRGSRSAGYVIVLLGAATFLVGCFLPYWGVSLTSASLSLYRLIVPQGLGAAGTVGGFLFLFGGVATIALIAMAGIRGYGWTRLVLAGATVVWSLTWIGMLLAQRSIPNAGRGVGWWVLLLGVAVVVIGTIVTWISESRAEGVSPAVPAGGGTDGDRYIDFF